MLRCYGYMYIYNRHHPRNYQVELAMSWGLEGCNSWGLLTDSFGIQLAQWIAASICGKLLCWMVFTYMFLAPKCCGVLFFCFHKPSLGKCLQLPRALEGQGWACWWFSSASGSSKTKKKLLKTRWRKFSRLLRLGVWIALWNFGWLGEI